MENNEWLKFELDPNYSGNEDKLRDANLILKNKIVKLEKSCLNLQNLAVSLNIELIMSGESSLLIFSRISDYLSSEAAVCQITKEMDSSRKFINFGVLLKKRDNENLNFKTIRKQEIPKHGIDYISISL